MKKALLIIDFIKGIAEEGSCAESLKKHPEVLSNTNLLIEAFRQKKSPLFFIRIAFDENYSGLPQNAPTAKFLKEQKKFLLETEETEFIEGLSIQKEDIVLNKKYGDPFYGSGLENYLENVEGVVLTGVSTDNALLYGAATAVSLGKHVTLIEDASAAPTDEVHEAALAIMKGRVVNEFQKTEEFLGQFS